MTDAVTDAVTDGFGAAHLPYGVWSRPGEPPRCGARIGDAVVDLAAALGEQVFAAPTLNAFLALGPRRWREVRTRLQDLVASGRLEPFLVPLADVRMRLPFAVGDYVDFYSSLDHATNAAQIFLRSTGPDVLAPNWRHLPVAYHGRAGTVVVSGTPVVRPCGQRKAPSDPVPTFGPTRGLDVECEVGFVVGVPTASGTAVPASAFAEHVFGVVLVNDWSARDIQMWESAPLGPFLGKSFATSIAAWVTPLDPLPAARVPAAVQDPVPLPYLRAEEPWALDLRLAITINGTVVSRPPLAGMYWTMPQQLAHATVNGAALRTRDLFATGTVSGPAREQRGSLLELSWNGRDRVVLDDGSSRTYLEDGDLVTLTGTAPAVDGTGAPPRRGERDDRARALLEARSGEARRPPPPGPSSLRRRSAGTYRRCRGSAIDPAEQEPELKGRDRRSGGHGMIDLSTRYLGLFLRSPLVASASPLTGRIETLRQLEAAGAGAVVLPSLFEEEIVAESLALHAMLQRGTGAFHDTVTPYPTVSSAENAVDAHLRLVEEAKRTLTIPVIASLNATTPGAWARYAKLLELAGADALELNLYAVQADPHRSGAEVESAYLEIVRDVADAISVPLSVKLSPYFSSLAEMARRVVLAGADGLVLFNRFYQPDLDVETLQVVPRVELSTSASLRLPLRWIGILRGQLDASLAATSGVHTAADAAKVLLVGADVAMMASVLLRQGPEHLWQIEAELRQWMADHDYASVGDMRGSASQKASSDPSAFERANYVTALTSYQVPADMLYT